MRQIQTVINIYKYNELSESAKKKVWDMIVDSNIVIEEIYYNRIDDLNADFPNSDVDFQFDFSSTQGSGVNIFGKFSTRDLVNYVKESLSEEEVEKILSESPEYFEFKENDRYTYSLWNLDYYRQLILDVSYKFSNLVCNKMYRRCKEIENYGYDMMEFNDDWASDLSEVNDWEFYENGNLYRNF